MILGGDEFRRTQRGNNNAYCQDNDISWYDWTLRDRNAELVRFVREMVALRKRYPALCGEGFYAEGEIRWFAPSGAAPDWGGPAGVLGCCIGSAPDLCLLFNATGEPVRFVLPGLPPERRWRLEVDTASAPLAAARGDLGALPGGEAFLLHENAFALLAAGAP